MNYEELIPDLIEALKAEIDLSKNKKSHTVDLEDGIRVDEQFSEGGKQFLYSFTTDIELQIPEDRPATLTYQEVEYEVTIISVIEYSLLLASTENLGDVVDYARLNTEPWFLLVELQERLEMMKTSPERNQWADALFEEEGTNAAPPAVEEARALLSELFLDSGEVGDTPNELTTRGRSWGRIISLAGEHRVFNAGIELQVANAVEQDLVYNEHQLRAVGHVLANKTSYIWGPPGTGKSRTLGMAAAALLIRGESVLVLAHSNAAVDVAMANVARHLKHTDAYRNGRILRYGPTTSSILQEQYPNVLTLNILSDKHPDWVKELESVEKRLRQQMAILRENSTSNKQRRAANTNVDSLRKQRAQLRSKLGEKEKLLVTQAYVVGCTLSKATISPVIYDMRCFDAVFIDEASMAYIPHCLFAAGWLARKRIAFFGDFRQLAPIAQAKGRAALMWLKRDVFELAGIRQKLEEIAEAKKHPTEDNKSLRTTPPDEADPRLSMLRIQYRMHPDIAAIPNKLYYYDLLQNDPSTLKETTLTVAAPPFSGSPVAVLNTALLDLYCFSHYASGSRFNPVSAFLTVIQARAAVVSGQVVGIVTPYNAQARLINRILHEIEVPRASVLVATVHKFQGSERDLMIFDLVEGQGKKPGLLFSGSGTGTARLTNVAISRAKGKFLYLLDHKYLKENFSDEHELRQFTNAIMGQAKNRGDKSILQAKWPETDSSNGIWQEGELPNAHCYPQSRHQTIEIDKRLRQAKEEVAISWPNVTVKGAYHFDLGTLLQADQSGTPVHLTGEGAGRMITQLEHGYRYKREDKNHAWYKIGVVCIDRRELWLYLQPELAFGTILHVTMPKTVALLRELFDLVPDEKWRQISLAGKTTDRKGGSKAR